MSDFHRGNWLEVLAILVVIGIIILVCYAAFGCVSNPSVISMADQLSDVAGDLSAVKLDVAGVRGDVSAIKQSAGRDVNEPWTARILALSSGLTPAFLPFMFWIYHRWKIGQYQKMGSLAEAASRFEISKADKK